MAKFSQIQKAMRTTIQERKRAAHGDPHTRKLKQKVEPIPISGKRKRKLFKKWRREKKAAIENGLVTMEDVEMSVADGTSEVAKEKTKSKFPTKKASRLRIKRLKAEGSYVFLHNAECEDGAQGRFLCLSTEHRFYLMLLQKMDYCTQPMEHQTLLLRVINNRDYDGAKADLRSCGVILFT